MPEMIVWPVSSSVRTWKVGSSSESAPSALPSLSWSTFVFGSMATEITGSGNSIRSSTIGWVGSQSVSPVVVFLRPTAATMSPANTAVLVLAVVGVHLQDAADPLLACPWSTLQDLAAGGELAGVHAEVRELADVRVAHDLEREGGERLVVVGVALDHVLGLHVVPGDRRRRRAGSGGSRRPRRAAAARPCS